MADENTEKPAEGAGAEGVKPADDNSRLKSALEKERTAAAEARKAAKAYADLGHTPEELAQFVAERKQAENEKLKKAGEWETLRQDLITKHDKALSAKDQALADAEAELRTEFVTARAAQVLASEDVGCRSPKVVLPHIESRTVVVKNPDTGKRETRILKDSALGKPAADLTNADFRTDQKGDWLSLKDFAVELRDDADFAPLFAPIGKSGSDTPRGSATHAQARTAGQRLTADQLAGLNQADYIAARKAARAQ